jgi:cytoskeleton protein RodZ
MDLSAVQPEAGAVSRPVLLRQSREAAGLHIAALAAALKVPVKKLEALEAGRYEELPDMTFARALASSACRQLKIDPAPVLEQIPVGHRPQLGDSAQTINTPFKHSQDPAPLNPMGWLASAVLGAIACC